MPRRKSPFLAGLLSVIPGLGQLYNEQFVKGFGILFGLGVGFLFMVVLPSLDFIGIGGSAPFSRAFDPLARGFNPFSIAGNGNIILPIAYFLVIAPIVWLYSLFDAIFTARRMNDENGYNRAVGSIVAGGTPVTATEATSSAPAPARLHRVRHDPGLTQREAVIWGIGLVALGLLGLAATLDGALWTVVSRGWPLLLVVGGAYFVWSEQNRKDSRQQADEAGKGAGQ